MYRYGISHLGLATYNKCLLDNLAFVLSEVSFGKFSHQKKKKKVSFGKEYYVLTNVVQFEKW